MTTNPSRFGCALAAMTVAWVTACGAPAPTQPPSAGKQARGQVPAQTAGGTVVPIDVEITGGQVRSASQRVAVPLGQKARLTVRGDKPDEVHVHGYDESVQLRANEQATIEFVADMPGVFEVELHDSGLALPSLEVR